MSGNVVNSGTVETTANGGLILSGSLSNDGLIKGDGTAVSASLILETGNVIGNGGRLEGTTVRRLIIDNLVENSGTIAAIGTDAVVQISGGTIAGSGFISASGAGAQINLDGNAIGGVTLAAGAGAIIHADEGRRNNNVFDDTFNNVTLTKGTHLQIDDETPTLIGTIDNSGTISEIPNADTEINITGTVTLTGGGDVLFRKTGTTGTFTGSGTLDNTDNTIAGDGNIGGGNIIGGALTFINGGIVDADISAGILYLATSGVVDTNAGTLEATNGGTLLISRSTINNFGLIDAAGSDVKHGHHVSSVPAFVELFGGTVSGGTLKANTGGEILAEYSGVGPSEIADASIAPSSPVVVTSGGTLNLTDVNIEADATVKVADGAEVVMVSGTIGHGAVIETLAGGSAVIGGPVTNSGTIFAAASGSYVDFVFATVTGGVTEIGNGTASIYGGETVSFLSTGDGGLVIDDTHSDQTSFSGTILDFGVGLAGKGKHLTATPHANHAEYIELSLVNFVSGAISGSYDTATHVLAVSSGSTEVAQITLSGGYVTTDFRYTSGSGGAVKITDPERQSHHAGGSIAPIAAQSANLGLLANYIANFGAEAHGNVLISSVGQIETAPPLLVHPRG